MSKTALPTGASKRRDLRPEISPSSTHGLRSILARALIPLASLRLTVVLFVMALFLVFCGTLMQIDHGIWTVLHRGFRTGIAWIPLQVFIQFGQIFLNFPQEMHISGSMPFPGGWLIGGLLLVNLLAAHLTRFQLSLKRSGILLIHSGLVILMLGELVTGLFAVEGRMTIDEGRSANYVTVNQQVELAIVDSSDTKDDRVMVIPSSFLKGPARIQSEILPFDVEVIKYMPNSQIVAPGPKTAEMKNLADAGDGLRAIGIEQPEVSGTAEEIDVPSAYVRFYEKGKDHPLGTYLVSVWFSFGNESSQKVTLADGRTFDVAMRLKRQYKPYSLQLLEFRFDRYPGTDIPRNFSSLVRIVDPQEHEDRQVLIKMNEPLGYRGETYYQADFDKQTEKTTVLQVVDNPGWILPYLACTMVVVGMVIHFCIHLVGFLKLRFAK